jgi:hypothetical protein
MGGIMADVRRPVRRWRQASNSPSFSLKFSQPAHSFRQRAGHELPFDLRRLTFKMFHNLAEHYWKFGAIYRPLIGPKVRVLGYYLFQMNKFFFR